MLFCIFCTFATFFKWNYSRQFFLIFLIKLRVREIDVINSMYKFYFFVISFHFLCIFAHYRLNFKVEVRHKNHILLLILFTPNNFHQIHLNGLLILLSLVFGKNIQIFTILTPTRIDNDLLCPYSFTGCISYINKYLPYIKESIVCTNIWLSWSCLLFLKWLLIS